MALLIILRKCPSISWKLLSSLWLICISSSGLLLLCLWPLTAVWSLWWILLVIVCTFCLLYFRLWIFNRRWLFIIFDTIVFLLDGGSRSTFIRLSVIFFNWVDIFIFFLILIGHPFFELLHPIDINIISHIYYCLNRLASLSCSKPSSSYSSKTEELLPVGTFSSKESEYYVKRFLLFILSN